MKDIVIKFVPQTAQHYDTLGDYWDKGGHVLFHISDLGNPNYNLAVAIHEVWEYFQMIRRGVTAQDTVDFDTANPELDDPGMSLEAPYHKEHCQSDVLERMCIVMSGEDWAQYDIDCTAHLEKYKGSYSPIEKPKYPRRAD